MMHRVLRRFSTAKGKGISVLPRYSFLFYLDSANPAATAKKYTDKIRQEEAAKKQQQSTIPKTAQEKLNEMERKPKSKDQE
ncbi:hypothetical protein CLU79DRAFT_738772 [Phycomyces nitens]|nr:hypothetical protein CLU79DRAFT_738772 [Phycomyces nitens]